MNRQLVLTGDGSHTFFVPELGEHYHSVHGAIRESLHIFIRNGYEKVPVNAVSILEAGFGTGLNALLTILASQADRKHVTYETWEAYPLDPAEYNILNYPEILETGYDSFRNIHGAEWGMEVPVNSLFSIKKIQDDIRNFKSDNFYDLVYFDAFGPDYQPELWETRVFRNISSRMKENSRLVTYSAKGQVRRNLRDAGFSIEKAPGPPGKREITIAIKL